MLDSFFQKPYIEEKKYKVVKYFVICQDVKLENKYFILHFPRKRDFFMFPDYVFEKK